VQTPTAVTASAPLASPEPTIDMESLVGERTVPDLWHENYWFRRHEAAYLQLMPRIATAAGTSGVVLEAGAGEGYGVDLLRSAGVGRIVALDYDVRSVAHGGARYPVASWGRANLARLPLADSSVAAISCFQVIEHLWTPWEFLAGCARVMAPGAPLIVTTPNRPVFSPGLGRQERPPNPYHVREFDAAELRDTVDAHLRVETMLGVIHGARLAAWEAEHGDAVAAQLRTPPDKWPAAVADLVTSVSAEDFDVVDLGSPASLPDAEVPGPAVHDLVLVARKVAG
jgi:SAM-dependent methyltransferase